MSPEVLDRPASAGSAKGAPLLAVKQLVKRFGGFVALDQVSLNVHAGEVVGLVGPNGSGKTTCINVITGIYAPSGGAIEFEGREIGGLPSHKLVHAGINRTFQIPKPFLSLTVAQNVEIAATYGARGASDADVAGILEMLDLTDQARRRADELNSIQQKMLDLARALATKPKLLCVDELAAGLNPGEMGHVAEHLRTIARSGVAVVVVEHLMGFLEAVTDRVIVLNAGKEIFEGKLAAAVQDPQVVEVFLGTSHGE
ncbi:amino acid ABC transporter ATP-binding protein [Pandoraea thiooxydans]|uniref:ABC transporter ATP-binding protein n=1 Tax=Pandoraea thiooxydans TaxID=445709 RepID=A0A0G3EMX7_9BURK|nr:ABC transporter ATP-binding protein [Pandoraea thiooxydans]AKJ68378.1 ABC transporter ATP-binding protein [Pandoraea thiooxydans]APR95725.1 amino acid ABC transporter ATP-binding protein [Pandoraea thiooxydans]